jgi:glycine oxidase ThiO
VKTWDVIIIGGGIIGLSLAISLRKRGASVLVVERGEPGREASHAAAGMLTDFMLETPAALQKLATASARMYPEFVHELEDESGVNCDLRDQGTLVFPAHEHLRNFADLDLASLVDLEASLADLTRPAFHLKERSVDPRALVSAVLQVAKRRDVDISSGATVLEVLTSGGRVATVLTERTSYHAPAVVNCAGAWSGQLPPCNFPTRPVKGQMLSVVGEAAKLRYVIRSPEVYLVPRSDGRLLIGATVEEAGYDKRTTADAIQRMHRAAISMIPALANARVLESWAGLRPGTPDDLPILGATNLPGYFVATGHFRDGILLAPITAHVMAQLITGTKPDQDLAPFASTRFANVGRAPSPA